MRVLSITIHRPANCGSALQAFALDRYLSILGYDAAIIDYIPDYLETEGSWIRNFVRKTLFYIPYNKRKKSFTEFIEHNCHLTPQQYTTYMELEKNPPEADVYIVGSDQLWNPCFNCGKDEAYYLSFVKRGMKISYATSLGNDKMPEQDLKFVASHLEDFSFVSVREKCSVSQLQRQGINNVKWVCDPTLLLKRSDYEKLAKDYKSIGKYTAVYLVEHSDLLDALLENLHDEHGLKTVGVGGYLKKYKCDEHLMDAGPSEFLGLIRDAEFVLATSFHATVFSLVFHKNFAIIPPKINSARIEQLLQYLGLENHIVTIVSEMNKAFVPIDYGQVEPKLEALRADSRSWLKNTLERMNNGRK